MLCVPENSPVTSVKDLEGKHIATDVDVDEKEVKKPAKKVVKTDVDVDEKEVKKPAKKLTKKQEAEMKMKQEAEMKQETEMKIKQEDKNKKIVIEKKPVKIVIEEPNFADEYNIQMKSMMDRLINSDALDLKNLEKHYSPKFAQIVTDIEESPGSVLIYSSFRTVEGLGILSEVLNRQGYKQILLKKIDNEYHFVDSDIFDEEYDNKRYVIFDQDKDKTKLLMNLFNNDFNNITNEMRKVLPENVEQIDIFSVSSTNAKFRFTDTSPGQDVFYQIITRTTSPA